MLTKLLLRKRATASGTASTSQRHRALVTTLALEKEINTFFRLHSPTVIARLRDAFPDLPENADQKTIFLRLRELRNDW